MIQAYRSNGYRNEDEGVDLKNILKKATDKTYFSSLNQAIGLNRKKLQCG